MDNAKELSLQAKVFDFALLELVHQHKTSFQPLWTVDSWAKFLIWLALNCGLSGERDSLEFFANAMGQSLTSRMRRIFFERKLDDLHLNIIADPADEKVFVMASDSNNLLNKEYVASALLQVGLLERVAVDRNCWESLDCLIVIPWRETCSN